MKAWDKGYFRQHDFVSFSWLYKDAVCFLPQNSGLGQAWNFKSQQSVKFDGGQSNLTVSANQMYILTNLTKNVD
jgi:hypothetical protein